MIAVIDALWASYLLDGLYHCRRFTRLAEIYSKPRLEAASRRALYYGQAHYCTVKRILARGADKLPVRSDTDIWGNTWPSLNTGRWDEEAALSSDNANRELFRITTQSGNCDMRSGIL